MSSIYIEGIPVGSTSVSMPCVLRDKTTFLPITGKVAADLSASYWIEGAAPVDITSSLTDLAAITTTFTANGVKEASASLQPGAFRIDWPNATWATAAKWVMLCVKLTATGDVVFHEKIPLTANVVQSGDTFPLVGSPAGGTLTAALAEIEGETDGIAAIPTNPLLTSDARLNHLDADVSSRTKPADTQAAVTLVTTTTSLTNAPTAGDFTAAMKTSLNAATPASIQTVTNIVSAGAITTSGGKVAGVILVDTLTTYTGNTLQTADVSALSAACAGGSLAAALAEIEAETDTLLAGVVVTTNNDKTGYSLSATGLNLVLVDGKTLPASLQIIAAIVAGKLTGSETNTEIYVGLDGTTTRVTATTDGSGNRSAMTYS